MLESQVEHKLKKRVEDVGGLCLKWVSPGWAGAPDRICLFPGGRIVFVEVKAPGEKPRKLQVHRMGQLEALGFEVMVVDSEESIEEVMPDETS